MTLNLIFQMTGLNIETDTIMEVACIITDQNLNIIAEGPDIIIHQPQNVLDNMSEWCKDTHGKVLIIFLINKLITDCCFRVV